MVEMLLDAGADVQVLTPEGKGLYAIAEATDVKELLKARGLKPEKK